MTENRVDYLVAGASHAALSALHAIRMHDQLGSLAVLAREEHLPYSPTVLPYVVSGRSAPDNVALKPAAYFSQNNIAFLPRHALTRVDAGAKRVHFANGETMAYGKLLLATGAAPIVPPIPGIKDVKFHVLRTLDDVNPDSTLAQLEAEIMEEANRLGVGAMGFGGKDSLIGCSICFA